MSETSTQTLDALFAAQKKAFAAEVYPTLETRLDRLRRLESAMVKNRVAIQKAVAEDFGNHHTIVTDMFETRWRPRPQSLHPGLSRRMDEAVAARPRGRRTRGHRRRR